MERTTAFGALLCLDGFLYNFTILPIRAGFAVVRLAGLVVQRWRPVGPSNRGKGAGTAAGAEGEHASPTESERGGRKATTTATLAMVQINSILRLLLLIIPTAVLLVATDTSKMYHSVRGQDTIKLYVM